MTENGERNVVKGENHMENNRAQWGSKIGFILAAAGSAVGLGNIWKFPGKAYEIGRASCREKV